MPSHPRLFLSAAALLFAARTAAAVTWNGGTGNWNSTNWSSGTTPGSSDDVEIDGKPATTSVVTDNATPSAGVHSLTIDAGDSFSESSGLGLGGNLTVNGNLSVTGSLSFSGNATISGTGNITLNNPIQAGAGITVTNNATLSNIIHVGVNGVGLNFINNGTLIQSNNLPGALNASQGTTFINNGTVEVVAPAGTAAGVLDVLSGTYLNTGLFLAKALPSDATSNRIEFQSGATISGGNFTADNGNRTINATTNANITFDSGVSLSNATLNPLNTGLINIDHGVSLSNVTFSAAPSTGSVNFASINDASTPVTFANITNNNPNLVLTGGFQFNVSGSLTTNAQITALGRASGAFGVILNLTGPTIFTGPAPLYLQTGLANNVITTNSNQPLTNDSNHTISGSGTIGTPFHNLGTVSGLPASGLFNGGTLLISAGVNGMSISTDSFQNDGTIQALIGTVNTASGPTSGPGNIRFAPLSSSATYINNGLIAAIGAGTVVDAPFSAAKTITFTGTGQWTADAGTINLRGNSSINTTGPIRLLNAGQLTVASGASTIHASHLFGNGTLSFTAGSLLSLDGNPAEDATIAANPFTGAITGAGNLTITGGIHILAGASSYTGATTLQAGSSLTIANPHALGVGNVTLFAANLTLQPNLPQAPILSKLLLDPGSNSHASAVDLTNNKLIVQVPVTASKSAFLSTLQNQIAYGATHATGIRSSTLPPAFSLALIDNAVTNFSTFGGSPVDSNSLLLAPELLGDANLDNKVDLTDLSTVLNNFGQPSSSWTDGNFDYAPTIDLTDLSDVLNNFGLSNTGNSAAPTAPTPTPEPASLALLALNAPLLLKRRRRSNPPIVCRPVRSITPPLPHHPSFNISRQTPLPTLTPLSTPIPKTPARHGPATEAMPDPRTRFGSNSNHPAALKASPPATAAA